jgi:hypothetical protein
VTLPLNNLTTEQWLKRTDVTSPTIDSDSQSTADSFATALPAHAQTRPSDGLLIDIETAQKSEPPPTSSQPYLDYPPGEDEENAPLLPPRRLEHTTPHEEGTPATGPTAAWHPAASTARAARAGTRRCSILRDQPATWLVKRTHASLSSLAAAVLLREHLIVPERLELCVPPLSLPRNTVHAAPH